MKYHYDCNFHKFIYIIFCHHRHYRKFALFSKFNRRCKNQKKKSNSIKKCNYSLFYNDHICLLGSIPIRGNSCIFRFAKNCRWSDSNVLAIDILFEKRKTRREKRVEEALDEKNFEEIIVFPIAFPFIAGPSALTTIILLIGNYTNFPEFQIPVILALVAALIVSLILMIGANFIIKYIPQQILHATARVMAFILAALATQFIIDGIKASFNI